MGDGIQGQEPVETRKEEKWSVLDKPRILNKTIAGGKERMGGAEGGRVDLGQMPHTVQKCGQLMVLVVCPWKRAHCAA